MINDDDSYGSIWKTNLDLITILRNVKKGVFKGWWHVKELEKMWNVKIKKGNY